MKKNLLLLIIIPYVFYLSTYAQKPKKRIKNIEIIDTQVDTSRKRDTVYGGYIKTFVVFESNYCDGYSYTFIYADSISCTIPFALYNLPKDKITYVYIYNGNRRTAEFTWEGENNVYKIMK